MAFLEMAARSGKLDELYKKGLAQDIVNVSQALIGVCDECIIF